MIWNASGVPFPWLETAQEWIVRRGGEKRSVFSIRMKAVRRRAE